MNDLICACGNPKCTGLCPVGTGKRLFEFYKNLKVNDSIRDAQIGSIRERTPGARDKQYLYVSGYEFQNKDTCGKSDDFSTLLTSKSLMVKVENIFSMSKKDLMTCVQSYINYSGLDNELALIFRKDIEGLTARTKVIVPIDFNGKYRAFIQRDNDSKREISDCEPTKMTWKVDDTGSVIGTVTFKVESKLYKVVNISDFGVKYFDTTFSKNESKVIKMDRFGYIQPVGIKYNNTTVFIDNTSIYAVANNEEAKTIGNWDVTTGGLRVAKDDLTDDIQIILDFVKSVKSELLLNRSRMAPYTIGNTNIIEI